MADGTGITWTDATWNPVRGCSRVSEGCRFCYAEAVAARFSNEGAAYHGFADRDRPGSKWTGRIELLPAMLDVPIRWQRPRRIFVNSMSDLFHERLPDEAIAAVFGAMALAPQHTFQVLTKRPERMLAWFGRPIDCASHVAECVCALYLARPEVGTVHPLTAERARDVAVRGWPLPHVHLGASVEDQDAAEARIAILQRCPAALRFLSCEPLLGPVDLSRHLARGGIGWVIVGGESGPGARMMRAHWAEDIRDQCAAAGVPFFFKQTGTSRCRDWSSRNTGKGDDPAAWPAGLRVQQHPKGAVE